VNRWSAALIGILVIIGPGALYSFSLFSAPLVASFHWSSGEVTTAFGLANFFLGVGAFVGGRWQDRVGPRVVAIVGSVLWGAGNMLTGLTAPMGVGAVWLCYGVIGGFGCGMIYIAALCAVIKWFPERRGFGGGLVIMGFGLGAFCYNLLLKGLTPYPRIAKEAAAYISARTAAAANHAVFDQARFALPHPDVSSLLSVFITSGAIFLIFGALISVLLTNPPAEVVATGERGFQASTRQMLGSAQFYILWTMLFLNVTAGIIIISNAVPIMTELTGASAVVVAGLYAYLSLVNGFGRLFWGALSDRIGRRYAFAGIFGIQVLVFFVMGSITSLPILCVAFAIVLLCYGGGFGTMPAYNADYFGIKNFGSNYGLNLTAWGCAGLAGPWFATTVQHITGSYAGALQPAAIMLSVAIIFPLISDQSPGQRKAPQPRSVTTTG
jgi:MFS family permease